MELYNEEDLLKQQKKTKIPLILGIFIVLLVIITILIIGLIIQLKGSIMKITLDGTDFSELENMLILEGEEIYIPIRQIAPYLGYEAYAGDYINKSEDKTKCYITNENETVQFVLDSNIITKTQGKSDYEYIELEKKIIQKNEELYTTIEGINNAYNVEFVYDKEHNSIAIYTMDYLVNYYALNVNMIEQYEATFSDKKAIFKDLLIIQEENKYGIIKASTGENVLELKYEDIKYLPSTSEFLVKTNNKYGTVSEDGNIKIKTVYDDIKVIDSEKSLYLVKSNNLYGIINGEGDKVIQTDYKEIGISNYTSFAKNGIENQYIILDELIPVKKDQLWGFYNIKGEMVTEFKYSKIGCSDAKENNSHPLLVIPSYKLVVVGENTKYNMVGVDGVEVAPPNVLEAIYLKNDVATGKNTYYMTYNNRTADIEEWLSTIQ